MSPYGGRVMTHWWWPVVEKRVKSRREWKEKRAYELSASTTNNQLWLWCGADPIQSQTEGISPSPLVKIRLISYQPSVHQWRHCVSWSWHAVCVPNFQAWSQPPRDRVNMSHTWSHAKVSAAEPFLDSGSTIPNGKHSIHIHKMWEWC